MIEELIITIMAAGEGTRMNSNLPKVLHLFNGKPMLVRIIETSQLLNPKKIIVITGKHNELIQQTLSEYINIDTIQFIQQHSQLGTGDAIKCCLPYYTSFTGDVLILNGDMPLINKSVLEKFIENSSMKGSEGEASQRIINILVAKLPNPTGYGRIIYDDETNDFIQIMEETECTDEQRKINIVNSGLYLISSTILQEFIPMIDNNNMKKEYYLTDIVKIIKKNTNSVTSVNELSIHTYLLDEQDTKYISGVNTQEELVNLEHIFEVSRREKLPE